MVRIPHWIAGTGWFERNDCLHPQRRSAIMVPALQPANSRSKNSGVLPALLEKRSHAMVARKAVDKKTVARRRTAARKTAARKAPAKTRRWSKRVTETSDALTLDDGVFKKAPHAIALSLKHSAERSRRRKSSPYRSAMSMLTFYINRGGKNLSAAQKRKLNRAKDELRALYHKQ
jgi:hypothetical protein